MAKDILGEAGPHFDELNKLRVLDPEVTQQIIELKEECKDFVDKIGQFHKIVGGLIELVDQLAKAAENERMKAIGAQNLLKTTAKQRERKKKKTHTHTQRSPTAATPGTNSRKENAAWKVSG
nr:intraflagellar transport protein 20 homolog [Delphinus delphis]